MSDLVLRLARPGEDARIADFINQNFDMRLPLINRADFYQFYYAHTPGAAPQFALAEQDGEILCAAGYILANQSETPDIWVSVWVAAKGHNGVGLELMDALSGLFECPRGCLQQHPRQHLCAVPLFGLAGRAPAALLPPWRTRYKGLAAGGAGSKFCSLAGTG